MLSQILNVIIKPISAADIKLGDEITGIGPWQKGTAETTENLPSFISTIVATLTVVASIAFAIYFIIGGLKWITAGGDKQKTQDAQSQMTQAAIGLIIVVVSFFIIGIVGGVLGIDILDPISMLGF